MLFSLFLFTAFLSIVRYYQLNDVIVTLVSQSPEVYGFIAILLLALRLGIAISKYYPMVVKFIQSIIRMSEMTEDLLGRGNARNESKDSPFNRGNPRRQYHSSAISAASRRTLNPTGQRRAEHPRPTVLDGQAAEVLALHTPIRHSVKDLSMYKTTLLRLRFNIDKFHEYILSKRRNPVG